MKYVERGGIQSGVVWGSVLLVLKNQNQKFKFKTIHIPLVQMISRIRSKLMAGRWSMAWGLCSGLWDWF
jgi:hypothetical protein